MGREGKEVHLQLLDTILEEMDLFLLLNNFNSSESSLSEVSSVGKLGELMPVKAVGVQVRGDGKQLVTKTMEKNQKATC